ncbi:MaoC family dehydratase N-terminal domain-containing protein [Variovorax paradoxus]|nr:MaoC/PaaZ C-terminal domain-containing protein [Variovorax paradoxus]MBT2304863.1 MaoC family dehydratase N-terminal domain-containing protein [Variovorax paradoxus]
MNPLYYEDVEVGVTYCIAGCSITEEHLAQFADLSGDHHPIHTDEDYARASMFGRRIAHGPLGIAIAIGLFGKIPEFQETTVAMTDIREWSFRAPIFIGDVVTLQLTIVGKRVTKSGRAIVDRQFRLVKADGTVAQEGVSGFLIKRRDPV